MCDECLTAEVRELVSSSAVNGQRYTSRFGQLSSGEHGVFIVSLPEAIAAIDVLDEDGRLCFAEEIFGEPVLETAHVRVFDAIAWVEFVVAYASQQPSFSGDYATLISGLCKQAIEDVLFHFENIPVFEGREFPTPYEPSDDDELEEVSF